MNIMKDKRPYIECPLEAALAAKNHGFKFTDQWSRTMKWTRFEGMVVCGCNGWNDVDLTSSKIKFYIHEKTLPLLEPQVGDLCEILGGHWNGCHDIISEIVDEVSNGAISFVECDQDYLDADEELEDDKRFYGVKIIQRNRKPFPTIEWE